MDVLNRIKGAAMVDKPVSNLKDTLRETFRNGPIEGVRTGVQKVWNTNMQRIDNIAGTKLSQGGPL
jgi:hypothetical protein